MSNKNDDIIHYKCEVCSTNIDKPNKRRKYCSKECAYLAQKFRQRQQYERKIVYEPVKKTASMSEVLEIFSNDDGIPVTGCNCGICQNARYNSVLMRLARYFFEKGLKEAIREDAPVPFDMYWSDYIKNEV